MRLRTLSTLLSNALAHLPGAEYERAKCEGLAAQVQEQRAHIEDLSRRLEYTTRQKDEAEERESKTVKAHDDALKAACEAVKVACDHAKASCEAEKSAHGDTHRHLTAAIAERDEWQRLHAVVAKTVSTHKGRTIEAEAERDALRAQVAELQSGEPVAWICKYEGAPARLVGNSLLRDIHHSQGAKIEPLFRSQPAAPVVGGEPVAYRISYSTSDRFVLANSELSAQHEQSGATVTPLYAAPAYGVEGEMFVCWEGACMWLTEDDDEGARDTGTRAEAEARARQVPASRVMRLVDADAPVVDVAKIREAIDYLVDIHAFGAAKTLRAAIGEKMDG